MHYLLIVLLFSQFANAEPVTIGSDEWFPMNGQPGAALPGFMIELAELSFGDIDYKLMPWVRALEEVRTGRVDCLVGADVRDVPGFVLPLENWGYTEVGVYTRQDQQWQYDGVESLQGKKFGVVKGYTYGEPIDSLIPKHPDIYKLAAGVDGLQRNIKQVVASRLDGFIADIAVANNIIKQMGLAANVKNVGRVGKPLAMYIACSPANKKSIELVDQVDKTTRRLRKSGELEAIMNKYGLTDWR